MGGVGERERRRRRREKEKGEGGKEREIPVPALAGVCGKGLVGVDNKEMLGLSIGIQVSSCCKVRGILSSSLLSVSLVFI